MLDDFTFQKNDRGFSDKAFAFMRKTIIPATKFLFKPRITNPENMPMTGPCFIYGNHSNYFDPFMLNVGMTAEPTAGVMTRDQFHKTLPRIFMDSIGIVPTSKYVPEPGSIRSVLKMIDQRRMIVIFPEGGRRWDGKMKPLIETTLKLFWKMGIPVHPVQIHGSYLGWPRWADKIRKGSVELHFLDPVHASDFNDYDTFATHCKNILDFDEYHPPEGTFPKTCSKPASGIHRFLYRCPDTGMNGAVFSPDGVNVFSRESDFRYRMNTASRLIDSDGAAISIMDLFEKINRMPMVFENSQEKVLLQKNGSQVNKLDKEQRLQKLDRGLAKLTSDGFHVSLGSQRFYFPLDQINYTSVEQNHKLTVTAPDDSIQINLEGQSAFQWQLYINRLKKGENPVTSL